MRALREELAQARACGDAAASAGHAGGPRIRNPCSMQMRPSLEDSSTKSRDQACSSVCMPKRPSRVASLTKSLVLEYLSACMQKHPSLEELTTATDQSEEP